MRLRTRKFVGILLTVTWVSSYALVLMALGSVFILGNGMAAELAFYVIGGLGWLPIEMVIIRWMSRPAAA